MTSLWDVKRPLRQGDSVTIDRIISRLDDDYDSEDFRKRVLSDSFLQSRLVGAQGHMTLMNVVPVEMSDDEVIALYDQVRAVVETHQNDEFRLSLTGALALSAQVNELVASDFSTLEGTFICVRSPGAFLSFSKLGRHCQEAMMVVLASLIWTLGLMALLGYPLTILSTILPAFLFCVGVADSIPLFIGLENCHRKSFLRSSCRGGAQDDRAPHPLYFVNDGVRFDQSFFSDVTVIGELGMSGGLGCCAPGFCR